VQGILSVQYFVHATVLVVHVIILCRMKRNVYEASELVSLIVTMQLTTLCGASVGVRRLLNLYHWKWKDGNL